MQEVRVMYECGSCESLHETHHEAEDCCQPEVYTVYVCPVCESAHDSKSDSEKCLAECSRTPVTQEDSCPNCLRELDTIRARREVAVAGHCSTCNPIYTVEENLAITAG